jgi:hypothetical protein
MIDSLKIEITSAEIQERLQSRSSAAVSEPRAR